MMPAIRYIILSPLLFTLASCALTGWDPGRFEEEKREANDAITSFKQKDPSLKRFFSSAYAYAVYPNVGKGGAMVGGAYGRGKVFRKDKIIANTTLSQLTVGFQLGGQAYSEIIFFRNIAAFNRFKSGELKFAAQASAIAVKAGAATNIAYENDVAVFTLTKAGLMYEASIGGQVFTYDPLPSP